MTILLKIICLDNSSFLVETRGKVVFAADLLFEFVRAAALLRIPPRDVASQSFLWFKIFVYFEWFKFRHKRGGTGGICHCRHDQWQLYEASSGPQNINY